jgi:outer membrane receptor protein involved in Fe transport
MTDEIDFDLESFRYVNIGKSRHRGVEAGIAISAGPGTVRMNYSRQDAVAQSGDHAGNRLKAIPLHTLTGAGSLDLLRRRVALSALATRLHGMYLDDANTIPLPNYTRVDVRLAVRVLGLSLFGEVRNLFDASYASTGYLDPSGSGEAYLYPAAGRIVRVGVISDR